MAASKSQVKWNQFRARNKNRDHQFGQSASFTGCYRITQKYRPKLEMPSRTIAVASSALSSIANTWPELLVSGNTNFQDLQAVPLITLAIRAPIVSPWPEVSLQWQQILISLSIPFLVELLEFTAASKVIQSNRLDNISTELDSKPFLQSRTDRTCNQSLDRHRNFAKRQLNCT